MRATANIKVLGGGVDDESLLRARIELIGHHYELANSVSRSHGQSGSRSVSTSRTTEATMHASDLASAATASRLRQQMGLLHDEVTGVTYSCSSPKISPRPPTSTVQDMCDTLSAFFTDNLGVRDAHIRTMDDPGSAIYGSGACSLETASETLAHASISRVDGATTNWTPGPGMEPMSGTSQAAWLFDGRPYGLLTITTLGDDRQCVMQLQQQHAHTLSGPLVLTDTQLHDVAELCIQLTRYLRK